MSYPYQQIVINGREVSIESVLRKTAAPRNDFEKLTFDFTYDWLAGKEDFELETSGSTGTPKKIVVSREQMTASARLTQQAVGLEQGSTALLCLSPAHIAGKMMLVRSFVVGMRLVAVTPSADIFSALPQSESIDFVAMVPYQIHEIVRSIHAHRLNGIKTIIIGGAALDPETSAILDSFSCRCYATYGMTETISHIALQAINGPNKSLKFNVLPGIQVELDERGCLVIDAPYLTQKIVTNDLATDLTKERFTWLGRWDNVINSGGVKLIPEVIEKKINEVLSGINITRTFMICSSNDGKLGNKVILLFEGDSFALTDIERLRERLVPALSRYEIPKEVRVLSTFSYTQSGKLNRNETAQNSNKSVQNFTLNL